VASRPVSTAFMFIIKVSVLSRRYDRRESQNDMRIPD